MATAFHIGVIVNYNTSSHASFLNEKFPRTAFLSQKSTCRQTDPLQIISRDLEFVAVGIREINGMRNFVVLKFELNAALFQFFLCSQKILSIGAERQMKYSNVAGALRLRRGYGAI